MMTIEEIYNENDISIRAYNICKYNGLDTIDKLLGYYLINYSFKNLRNCGARSNEELIGICEKYKNSIHNNIKEIDEESIEKICKNLTEEQENIINSFILIEVENLSVRTRNALLIFFNDIISISNIVDRFFLDIDFKTFKINNIGEKSALELEIFISKIRNFIYNIVEERDEKKIILLKNKLLVKSNFHINQIPIDILQSGSIFQLVDFFIKNNLFYSSRDTMIIKKTLKIYQDYEYKTFEEVALESGISRERVRQIRKKCLETLFEKLSFIKNLNDDLFQNYDIDISSNILEISREFVNKINTIYNLNFTKEFILLILAAYLNDRFFVIGDVNGVLKYSHDQYSWKNLYIINRRLSKIDFISFVNDIDRRIGEKNEETYSFNFKSYLAKFINNEEIDTEILYLGCDIAEKIINDEFELFLDLDDNLVFKRNTIKLTFEYAYEALEILGEPSNVEEITQKIVELYPNYETDNNKVRSSMKRKYGFVPIGRTSVFGLKKWEKELENFKGGTIRSISYEFLKQFDTPKHITEITKHILNYRPNSNEKSIYYNLKKDESEGFSFFKNSYIGLKEKKYSKDFDLLKTSDLINRKSWEERFEDLQQFLLLENRLPFSNAVSEEEIKLYRWLSVQKSKIKKNDLDYQKEQLVNEVFKKYSPKW